MLPHSRLRVNWIPSEAAIGPIYSRVEARKSRLVSRAFTLTPPMRSVSLYHTEIVI